MSTDGTDKAGHGEYAEYNWVADAVGPPLRWPDHVMDMVTPHFTRQPHAKAITDWEGSITYGELDVMSRAIGIGLSSYGCKRGDTVVVRCPLSRWAVVAILGVLRGGCSYVAIDTAFPIDRQRQLQAASAAALVITEPDAEGSSDELASVDLLSIAKAGMNSESRVVPCSEPELAYEQMPAYTQFTSGSTGEPKAVVIPSAALSYSIAARLEYYRDPVRVFLMCSSISFDASVASIFWTLATGGHLIVPSDSPSKVVQIASAAHTFGATHIVLIPSLYDLLLGGHQLNLLSSLDTVIVVGEACPSRLVADHFARLPGARMFNEYGPAECTIWSTVHECEPTDADRDVVPIGRPIPGASLYLRTAKGASPAVGDVGELWISGPGVVSTIGDQEPSGRLAKIRGQLAYRSGDLVSMRADGLLEFRGRTDDQLKLAGVRITLSEVERLLAASSGVRSVGIGVAGRAGGRPDLVAFVVPSGAVEFHALRSSLLARLPSVAVPRTMTCVDSLPMLANGKVDRFALDRRAELVVEERRAKDHPG
jgi:amino acid adenylation domain-containing protein